MVVREFRVLGSVAGIAVSALLLVSCGDSETPQTVNEGTDTTPTQTVDTFQFDEQKTAQSSDSRVFSPNGSSAVVKLSEELRNALPDGSSSLIDQFELDAKQLTSEFCRLDITVKYADGADKEVGAQFNGIDDIDENYYSNESSRVTERLFHTREELKVVKTLPSDEELNDGELYATPDYAAFTRAGACSDDMEDNFAYLQFPYAEGDSTPEPGRTGLNRIADFDLAIVADETDPVLFINGNVDGAEVGVSGSWVPSEN